MQKSAIVFLNMGAPRNPQEVELFLHNMFNDKNIITVKSNLLRAWIASRIIKHHKEEAIANYAKLGGVSPLVKNTDKLLAKVRAKYPDRHVVHIMRYTPPFAFEELKWLQLKGVTMLYVIPLYPHYSTTTTGSSLEDLHEALAKANYSPHLKIITRFYENARYNDAIIERIKEALGNETAENFDLIFSAHSLPQKIVDAGDPYEKEINAHVQLLKEKLTENHLHFRSVTLAYQSKVGKQKWLEPSLDSVLEKMRERNVLLFPISFILDNSETDFELHIEYEEIAKECGVARYRVARCPNDADHFVEAIDEMVRCF